MANDVWPYIHTERRALVADLEKLTPEQWNTASLCDGWSVRDVVAHMTATAKITAGKFFPQFVGSGFNFEKVQAKGIAAERGAAAADTLAAFTRVLSATSKPPGPAETPLGETLVHSEDIRRPLGITHEYDTAAAIRVAEFYRKSNLIIGGKRRAAGLRFRADNATWTAGDGPEVSGPLMSLVLAIAGRKAALDDLSGDGVATLRSRS